MSGIHGAIYTHANDKEASAAIFMKDMGRCSKKHRLVNLFQG